MITELTKEQEAELPAIRDKWVEIGLSTKRMDTQKAEEAVRKSYKIAGLEEPRLVIFADGPVEGNKIANVLENGDVDHLFESTDKNYSDQELMSEIMNRVDEKSTLHIAPTIYGSMSAPLISFYDAFRQLFNICHEIEGVAEIAENCGWVWCYEHVAIISDRPLVIKLDEEDRLHCENGPAVAYGDGTKIYSWRGVTIPEEWIENPDSLTGQVALTHPNIEERRAACEILGWAKVLEQLNAQVIDEDPDPEIGSLVEVEIPDIGKERFLKVLCGTRREFALPVPPDMQSAIQAQAWTFGMEPDEFVKPEIRT